MLPYPTTAGPPVLVAEQVSPTAQGMIGAFQAVALVPATAGPPIIPRVAALAFRSIWPVYVLPLVGPSTMLLAAKSAVP